MGRGSGGVQRLITLMSLAFNHHATCRGKICRWQPPLRRQQYIFFSLETCLPSSRPHFTLSTFLLVYCAVFLSFIKEEKLLFFLVVDCRTCLLCQKKGRSSASLELHAVQRWRGMGGGNGGEMSTLFFFSPFPQCVCEVLL